MTTSESLYNAVIQDDINLLTPGSITDYGFTMISEENASYLFGAYQAISKFIPGKIFIDTMHLAVLEENLHEKMNELTKKIPEIFQVNWNNFIANGCKICNIYL